MKRIIMLLACVYPATAILAQGAPSLKRIPYILHVKVDEKNFYEENLPSREYVYPDNSVQLYPGRLCIWKQMLWLVR